jgi:hypothetical protein
MKKSLLFIIIFVASVVSTYATDGITRRFTVYEQFKPAIIHLATGKTLTQPLANIFLRNSTLLYVSGSHTMQANMNNIEAVEFDDRQYVRIDTLLAYCVDSVGSNKLYCATMIDVDAYRSLLVNNKQLTNISFGDVMQTATVDIEDEKDIDLPTVDKFFYLYNGKFVPVHERNIIRVIPKDKRHIYRSVISLPDFKWTEKDSLMKLLRVL